MELDFEQLYPDKSFLLLNNWKLFEESIIEPLKLKCKTPSNKTKLEELSTLTDGMLLLN